MFNLRLCNAATIRYSILKCGHMHFCGKARAISIFHHIVVSVTVLAVLQTPRKLRSFHRTEGGVWPDFVDFKHDYTQEFYRSYSVFTGKCPRTDKFRGVCIAAIRCGNACHGPHSDSVYSSSEHRQYNSPRLVKRDAGFPSPRQMLIASYQLWRVNDSPYYQE